MNADVRKTKLRLVEELAALRRRVALLENGVEGGRPARASGPDPLRLDALARPELESLANDRTRELQCLYNLSRLVDESEGTLEEFLARVPALLPPAWRRPGQTRARVTVGAMKFNTPGFRPTKHRQYAPIRIQGREEGVIEVHVKGRRGGGAPFTDGEQRLLDAFAERLGRIIERRRSAERLAQSEERFRLMAENARDMVYRMTIPEGRYEYVSQGARPTTGYAPDAFYARPLLIKSLMHPDWRGWFDRQWRRLKAGRAPACYEYMIVDPDGRSRWIHQYNTIIRDASGAPTAIEGIVVDISAIKAREEALKAANEKLRETNRRLTSARRKQNDANRRLATQEKRLLAILDGIDEAIYVADPDTHELLHVNQTVRRRWDRAALGKKCYEVVQKRASPCPDCTNHAIFGNHNGESVVWETRDERTGAWYRCADKAIRWVDGRMVRLEIASDITAVKRATMDLDSLFKLSTDLVTIADADNGRFLRVNPAMSAVLGYAEHELLGRSPLDFVYQPDIESTRQAVEIQRNEGKSDVSFANRWVCADGQLKWLEWVSGSDRRNRMTYAIGRDVTARKRLEESQRRIGRELERKNRELEQLVYVTSHDLRSPLVNVQGFCHELRRSVEELIGRGAPGASPAQRGAREARIGEDIHEALEFIQAGTAKMDALLSGLLRLSRLGGAALDVKAVDARAVLRGALKAMDFTISQAGASVRIEEPFAPCMADANLLNQAFSNVLDNALKYRDPARRLTIVVSCDCTDGDPVYCIADNGIGMEQRYCDTVFELFHRLDPDAAEGDGLGLTIVRKSVERLNGAVWAVSRPGAGTRMHIRLPAVRDEGVHYSPQEELCNGK